MAIDLFELALRVTESQIAPAERSYRPPTWPPPDDWVVSENAAGASISKYGDTFWDFSHAAGRNLKFDFAGGRHAKSAPSLGTENQNLLRLWATWIIWGPRGALGWATLKNSFDLLRRIVVLCENNGILASELSRFEAIRKQIGALYVTRPERGRVLHLLDRLLRAADKIGCAPLDETSIVALAEDFSRYTEDETEQTAYIPARIWKYQLTRLRECLEDYILHQSEIEACFDFCLEAYAVNFGSVKNAVFGAKKGAGARCPFSVKRSKRAGARTGYKFHGRFEQTAAKFGLAGLLQKWVCAPDKSTFDIRTFSKYLSLIQCAGSLYVANFTLQRKEETGALRADCLVWEVDTVLGRIPVIRGDTTKTDPDPDARWPTSPSVEVAIQAMASVARLRIKCAAENHLISCTEIDIKNPFLNHVPFEPWSTAPGDWAAYTTKPPLPSYQAILLRYPRLLDQQVLRITCEDLAVARMFTPNLDKGGKFAIGEIWPLAFHQLRRTTAVNMFASGLLSDSSMQVILKHLTLLQSIYYGNHFSRVRFNDSAEEQAVAARYEVMARQIEALVSERYVSPSGTERKDEILTNIVGVKDFKSLVASGRNGEVSFRATRLGACTKIGPCDYGGVESIARCSGGDGEKPCGDALFDVTKVSSVQRQLADIETKIGSSSAASPRLAALQAEAQGLRNYLNGILS